MSTDLAQAKLEFIRLTRERTAANAHAEDLARQLGELRQVLEPAFLAERAKRWQLEEGTIYTRSSAYASIDDPQAAVAAAQEAGLTDLVTLAAPKVASLAKANYDALSKAEKKELREQIEENTGEEATEGQLMQACLPPSLAPHVTIIYRPLLMARPQHSKE